MLFIGALKSVTWPAIEGMDFTDINTFQAIDDCMDSLFLLLCMCMYRLLLGVIGRRVTI